MLGRFTAGGGTSPSVSGLYLLLALMPAGTTTVSMIWMAENRAR